MLKKCVCWICVVCAASVMGLPVRAKQTGSIRVTPMWGGVPIAGGTVSVCYVGQKTQDCVQFTDGLANWMVSETEVYSADWLNWLSAKAADRQVYQAVMPEEGAVFSGLSEGIYLVQQYQAAEGFVPFAPFLLCLPENGSWNISASPGLISTAPSPETGDYPAPIIGAMGIGLSVAILMVLVDERKK